MVYNKARTLRGTFTVITAEGLKMTVVWTHAAATRNAMLKFAHTLHKSSSLKKNFHTSFSQMPACSYTDSVNRFSSFNAEQIYTTCKEELLVIDHIRTNKFQIYIYSDTSANEWPC